MKTTENKYKKQIFVCCNTKKDGSGCGPRGGDELREKIKEKLYSYPSLLDKVRVNKSGCMDYCNDGIAVQIQPSDKLILNAKPEDAGEIWEEFLK